MQTALRLAGRAPSFHNTQPWYWVFDGHRLHLYADSYRTLSTADPHGRQQLISCGAVLHHARTAFAALGWHADPLRLPDPYRPGYLAVVDFRPWPDPPAGVVRRAHAITERYSERRPMRAPGDFDATMLSLRRLARPHRVEVDVLEEKARPQLAAISEQTAAAHREDQFHQQELMCWAEHFDDSEGFAETSLISADEASRTHAGHPFPTAPQSVHHRALTDAARLVVLSCAADNPDEWPAVGEALSAILLECASTGLSTCALTHLTESRIARAAIAVLLPHALFPQVVVRIGVAPVAHTRSARTSRRRLSDCLEIRTTPIGE